MSNSRGRLLFHNIITSGGDLLEKLIEEGYDMDIIDKRNRYGDNGFMIAARNNSSYLMHIYEQMCGMPDTLFARNHE